MSYSNSLYMAWHGMASRMFGRALVRQELGVLYPPCTGRIFVRLQGHFHLQLEFVQNKTVRPV